MAGPHSELSSARLVQLASAAVAPTPGTGQISIYSSAAIPNTPVIKDSTGLSCAVGKVLARVSALDALGAFTTELVGISFTGIPVGDFVAGRTLRVSLWGISTNIATASTLTLRLRIGTGAVNATGGAASANTIVASVALATAAAAKTTVPWTYGADFTAYTTGTSGTGLGQCHFSGGPAGAVVQTGAGLTAAVALNTTVANNVDFTLQPGSSTDITATTIHGGRIEIL
jgi:hypothetical protein